MNQAYYFPNKKLFFIKRIDFKKQNYFIIWILSPCQAKEKKSSGMKREMSIKAT